MAQEKAKEAKAVVGTEELRAAIDLLRKGSKGAGVFAMLPILARVRVVGHGDGSWTQDGGFWQSIPPGWS